MASIAPDNPSQALTQARAIWAALCMGLIFTSVALYSTMPSTEPPSAILAEWPLSAIAWVLLLTVIPLGLFVRGQVFKRGWEGDAVTPAAYLKGNIIAWACCEGTAFVGLILGFMDHRAGSQFSAAVIAFATLVALWPNGRAMWPLGVRE